MTIFFLFSSFSVKNSSFAYLYIRVFFSSRSWLPFGVPIVYLSADFGFGFLKIFPVFSHFTFFSFYLQELNRPLRIRYVSVIRLRGGTKIDLLLNCSKTSYRIWSQRSCIVFPSIFVSKIRNLGQVRKSEDHEFHTIWVQENGRKFKNYTPINRMKNTHCVESKIFFIICKAEYIKLNLENISINITLREIMKFWYKCLKTILKEKMPWIQHIFSNLPLTLSKV